MRGGCLLPAPLPISPFPFPLPSLLSLHAPYFCPHTPLPSPFPHPFLPLLPSLLPSSAPGPPFPSPSLRCPRAPSFQDQRPGPGLAAGCPWLPSGSVHRTGQAPDPTGPSGPPAAAPPGRAMGSRRSGTETLQHVLSTATRTTSWGQPPWPQQKQAADPRTRAPGFNVCPLFLQVRVGVQYCGLNFADILACQGLYQDRHTPPFTPGE